MQAALGTRVGPGPLEAMISANIGQDGLAGLLREEFHFDGSQFAKSLAYLETCRMAAAQAQDPTQAWAAFGRLSHGAQDFYAHSNYVALWRKDHPGADVIDGLDPAYLRHPDLISGKVYWPLEALWIVPALRPWLRRTLPADSHAAMNLDHPGTGPRFADAMRAAEQRTVVEFERTLALIGETQGPAAMAAFLGRANHS
jgi:hypothetical protein